MTTPVREDATPSTSQPPQSATAQRITAGAAFVTEIIVVIATLCGISFAAVAVKVTEGSFNSHSDVEGPIVVRQGLCLTYSNFVLDQYHASLTVQKIEGIFRQVTRDCQGS